MTTLTLGNNFTEFGNFTTTLADVMKQEYFKTFDRLLAEFDRRFTDNLPVLSTLEALDPSSTMFMDIELLKLFSSLYGELDIDSILLESQAGIAKRFLLNKEKKPENFLAIVDHLQALPVPDIITQYMIIIIHYLVHNYSEVIKVLRIAALLPETTASNERLFSSLEIVKNYLWSTTGDDRLSHLLLIFAEKDLVKNLDYNKLVYDFTKMKTRRFPLLP